VGISINKISLTFESRGLYYFTGWMITGPNTREEVDRWEKLSWERCFWRFNQSWYKWNTPSIIPKKDKKRNISLMNEL